MVANDKELFNDLSKLDIISKEEGMLMGRGYSNGIEKEINLIDKSNFISKSFLEELDGEEYEGNSLMRQKFDESSFNTIRIQTYLEKKNEKDFTDLRMVQDFQGHNSQIWVGEISHNYQYIATGGNSGYLKIWKIITGLDDAEDPFTLLDIKPFAVMPPTKTENGAVLDGSWGQKIPNYIVTAHFDK